MSSKKLSIEDLEKKSKGLAEKITKLTEEKKKIDNEIKRKKEEEENKLVFGMGEILKQMGFTSPEQIKEFVEKYKPEENKQSSEIAQNDSFFKNLKNDESKKNI